MLSFFKKPLYFFILFTLVVFSFNSPALANYDASFSAYLSDRIVVFKIGDISYYVKDLNNGQITHTIMDTAPEITNGRTFVPVRFLANALGVDDEFISWDSNTKTATIEGIPNTIKLTINKNEMKIALAPY